ncbi:MAG: hypothetical protein OEU36_24115 [Gammaproteobacteria bacterium]|nr:hypothetical protein [Gammaproteobacteria bacterium]
MNIKRLSIGSVVGAIALYLLGMLIWQTLFVGFFEANAGSAVGVDRDIQIVWAVIVGTLFYAALLTLALECRSGSKSLVDGLKIGAVVGALVWGTADFTLYGITNLNTLTAAVADTLLEGVRGGIAGGVITAVLSKVGD